MILLIVLGVLYAIQLIIMTIMFFDDAYKSKDDIYRDAIPFYWVGYTIVFIRDSITDKWNGLN